MTNDQQVTSTWRDEHGVIWVTGRTRNTFLSARDAELNARLTLTARAVREHSYVIQQLPDGSFDWQATHD